MLLKRLRDTMARAESVEVTLGEVVRLVANEMVAEVCSIYLLRAGEVLELFATQGLNPSAVHATRLRVGEGLVGAAELLVEGFASVVGQKLGLQQFPAFGPLDNVLTGLLIVVCGLLGIGFHSNLLGMMSDE